jgi:Cu2+-exporting ATPase
MEHEHEKHERHEGFGRQDHSHHIEEFKTKFWISLVLSVPIVLLSEQIQIWFNYSLVIPFQREILFVLSLVLYLYGGLPFLKGMIQEVKMKQPGMMTLIGTAITVAFVYSAATVFVIVGNDFFWELATLIDVMLFGHWVEAKSVLGASRALEELVKIMPTVAHLEKDGKLRDVPVSQLKPGDIVLIRPGEKSPSDGVVVEGESFVNEALLTGESKPIHKEIGDEVIGGSINGEGALRVKIEKTGEETYLAQVITLVKQAQESKSRTQDLANRASAYLFYIAISVGTFTYIGWLALGLPDIAIERAVTVMVIACPHALGLAIPLVVALSTSITAKSGILIRDRIAFETIKDIDVVVFDKTGTLTVGKFGVTDVVAYIPKPELLRQTASLELNSEHIIATAIVTYTKAQGVQIPKSKNFTAIPGKGIMGRVNGKEVYVGSPNLLNELNITLKDPNIKALQAQGKTVVFTIANKKLVGAFALSDAIRSEAYEAIRELRTNNIEVYMLTGDAKETAKKVSQELGIDKYFAQVLPAEKAKKIARSRP